MCVQLGVGDYSEELCRDLTPVLMLVARDPSVSANARAKVINLHLSTWIYLPSFEVFNIVRFCFSVLLGFGPVVIPCWR